MLFDVLLKVYIARRKGTKNDVDEFKYWAPLDAPVKEGPPWWRLNKALCDPQCEEFSYLADETNDEMWRYCVELVFDGVLDDEDLENMFSHFDLVIEDCRVLGPCFVPGKGVGMTEVPQIPLRDEIQRRPIIIFGGITPVPAVNYEDFRRKQKHFDSGVRKADLSWETFELLREYVIKRHGPNGDYHEPEEWEEWERGIYKDQHVFDQTDEFPAFQSTEGGTDPGDLPNVHRPG